MDQNNNPSYCEESTLSHYEIILELHVLPVFGSLNLKGITRGKVKDFLVEKLNAGYANSTMT